MLPRSVGNVSIQDELGDGYARLGRLELESLSHLMSESHIGPNFTERLDRCVMAKLVSL